jgi:hypothetical protein
MMKRLAMAGAIVSVFTITFISVYDHYMTPRWGYGLLDFFTMEGRVEGYLDKGAELGSSKSGKVDAIRLPLELASKDVTRLAFGVGIGNTSPSALGQGFEGAYFESVGHLVGGTVSVLLWELGIVGCLLAFWVVYLVFRDALIARYADGFVGGLALAWIGVVAISALGMFYKRTIQFESVSVLFWFYSGVVVAAARSRRAID